MVMILTFQIFDSTPLTTDGRKKKLQRLMPVISALQTAYLPPLLISQLNALFLISCPPRHSHLLNQNKFYLYSFLSTPSPAS